MIKKIKKKSIVILTTHSMNEAEFLSDRICIIKKGFMECIGSSLELKKIYGDGYLISIVSYKNKQKVLIEKINEISKNVKLICIKGDCLVYSLSFDYVDELNFIIFK